MTPFRTILFAVAVASLMSTDVAVADGQNNQAAPLVFQVSVVPADPFHPINQVGAKPAPMTIRRGQVVKVVIEGKLKAGYHTYPMTSRTGKQESAQLWKYTPAETLGLAPLWPITETPPDLVDEKELAVTLLEHQKDFTWTQDVLVLPQAKPGMIELPINLRGLVCDDKGCVPVREDVKATFQISAENAMPIDAADAARLNQPPPKPSVILVPGQPDIEDANGKAAPAAPLPRVINGPGGAQTKDLIFSPVNGTADEYKAAMEGLAGKIKGLNQGAGAGGAADLWGFILAGIFWGAISLVTPCVFPMIPITVSFFLKQSEKEHHKPITMALVYSGTIVVVLTLAAAFLLSVFRWLSVNPIMNYGLGALFVFFALSLFGMYEIELPSGLARFTSSREGQGGAVGTIFMALTFTIISFACVAPFLGGFGGTSATTARPWWHNILGGLAFSATFAAPFFFLALFPTLLRKMPKSGNWLNSVKVVMGFLELAAALKFFRSAELVLTGSEPWLFTFDFVMGIYVAMCFLCGLYLLGVYRLPHDTPEEHLGVMRMIFAGLFLAFGFYFMPSLFKAGSANVAQQPNGAIYAWVDSFLLPDGLLDKEMPHTANLPAAIAEAREVRKRTEQAKRVFIDFTGVTCTNCKINERTVFPRPNVFALFEPYIVVKMFTDTVPKKYYAEDAKDLRNGNRQESDADVNLRFQKKIFDTEQLPLYVILEPQLDDTIQVVRVYDEGRINNEAAFADFLRNPK
jgi:cytochrome c biogenesis protein CcdA